MLPGNPPLCGNRSRQHALAVITLVISAVTAEPVRGQSELPEFSGERLTVSGTDPAGFEIVRPVIAELEAAGRQTYYVVVIQSSGVGPMATRDFTDRLYAQWAQQARQKNISLDPDRAVVFVLALQNRQLSVHTGAVLQQTYGLKGQTIDRQLVEPHFIPQAKAGNYPEGLRILLRRIHEWIVAIDDRSAAQQRAAAERAKQLAEDATAMLASCRTISDTVETVLSEQVSAGLNMSKWQDQRTELTVRLQSLESAATAQTISPQTLLEESGRLYRQLAAVHDGARSVAGQQQSAHVRTAALLETAGKAADQLEAASRSGLVTRAIGIRLDRTVDAIRAAESQINDDPALALQSLAAQESSLEQLRSDLNELPESKSRFEATLAKVASLSTAFQSRIDVSRSIGVSTASAEALYQKTQERMAQAQQAASTDYNTGWALLDPLEGEITAEQQQLQTAFHTRQFWTRTLPMMIALGAVAAGLLALLILRLLHLRIRKPLDERCRSFRQKVVQLSDDIDALRERHRALPFTDQDYQEPMTGATLEMYNGVQTSLEQLRQRWLELMDVWDKVEHLTKSEHYFGRKLLKEATAALETVPVSDVEQTLNAQCVQTLDRLQDAHEQSGRLEEALDMAQQRVREQVDQLASLQLATTPYEAVRGRVSELRTQAAQIAVADPIGCQRILESATAMIRDLGQRTEKILQHRRGIDELGELLTQTVAWIEKLRQSGLRFCEEGSDPSTSFTTIDHHRTESLQLLNQGEADTAAEHLKRGFAQVAAAKAAIQQLVDAKAQCELEIPKLTAEQDQLQTQLLTLDSVITSLRQEFAPASWADVGELKSQAGSTVSACAELLAQATLAGSKDVQHYLKARDLLQQLQQQQATTTSQLATGSQRLNQLRKLQQDTVSAIQGLQQEFGRVRTVLQSSNADREAVNRRFRAAETEYEQVLRLSKQQPADWTAIAETVRSLRTEIADTESQAQEDLRLADQADRQMTKAARMIREAESFYRSGIKAKFAAAVPQLEDARRAMRQQNYEQAIHSADAATVTARRSMERAEQEADAADRRREQKRREGNQTFGTGIGLASTSMSSASLFGDSSSFGSSAPSFDPSPSPSMPDTSSSSSSSWSSETSQSSW